MPENYSINNNTEDSGNPFPSIPKLGSGVGFQVPEGYFEALRVRVMENIEEEQLDLPSTLSLLSKNDPFHVPEDYFETLPAQILLEIALQASAIPEQTVPPNYFEELALDVDHAVRLEQLEIAKDGPFAVPGDYFEWLPSRIQDRILEQKKASFGMGRIRQLMPGYLIPVSLAAVCVLLLGIRFFIPVQTSSYESMDVALNEGDRKEVIENLDLYGFDDAVVLDHVALKGKALENTETSTEKRAAIDYLIENNIDVNSINPENTDNI